MKKVKVSEATHATLKELQRKTKVTFDEIISLALSLLEGKKLELHSTSKLAKITVKLKKSNLNYDRVKDLVGRGYDLFVPMLNRRQARYIRKQLAKRFNTDVIMLDSICDKQSGFLFLFVH